VAKGVANLSSNSPELGLDMAYDSPRTIGSVHAVEANCQWSSNDPSRLGADTQISGASVGSRRNQSPRVHLTCCWTSQYSYSHWMRRQAMEFIERPVVSSGLQTDAIIDTANDQNLGA
jgi:hypothetical protein